MVPFVEIRWVPSVKSNTTGGCDTLSQHLRVIVGVGIAEGLLNGIKEILPVNKSNGTLRNRLRRHSDPPEKQNPAGGLSADPTGSR